MRRALLIVCSLLALAGGPAVTASCGTQQTNGGPTGTVVTARSGPMRRQPAVTVVTRVTRNRGRSSAAESAVVRAFAVTYGRYLDGRVPATALPDATPTAQAQAGAPIPAPSRAGLPYIHRSAHANGFTVGYRDRAHSYSAQLALARRRARWQITQVAPPDLDSILRRSRAIPLTSGSKVAATAARRFLYGYLSWLYGHARATAIHVASAQLIEQLKAHPPKVPATLRSVHPRLIALGTQRARGGWLALTNITAGQQTYELTVTVVRSRGQWRVTKVNAPF
jgi:hypothetical protein